jgi:hypothetical protein
MYRKRIEQAAVSLPDEDALTAPELFPHWEPDIAVETNERIFYEDKLYRVVQGHTTQEGWEPDKTPALFTEIAKPGEIPVWKQPTGAQDAYMIGDKVHFPEKADPVYISIIDNNTWAPNVYGWERA